VDRVGEPGPGDDRGKTELVAAGEEDRRGVAQGRGGAGILRLGSLFMSKAGDSPDAEIAEELAVPLGRDVAERRGGRDDDHVTVWATGERREPRQDELVPDLILGSADQHDRAGATEGAEGPAGFDDVWIGSSSHGVRKV
jgi:hypothetical protein